MRDETAAAAPSLIQTGAAPLQPPAPLNGRERRRAAYAALDLGTNNCRLLIAEPTFSGFRVIDAFSRIVRLGEGLGTSDRLSEIAIERTVEALRICRTKMQARGVQRAKVIATEACRFAVNGAAFVERVVKPLVGGREVLAPADLDTITAAANPHSRCAIGIMLAVSGVPSLFAIRRFIGPAATRRG